MRRLRVSFATRLLAGALGIVVAVLVGISAFLIISRDRATRDAAVGNAENRAAVTGELLSSVTGSTGETTVKSIASQPALATALSASNAATVVPELFRAGSYTAPRHLLAVLDAGGNVMFSTLQQLPAPGAKTPSVVAALSAPGPVAGLEVIGTAGGAQILSVDSAMRVADGSGKVLGVVVDVAPLLDQIIQFAPVIGSDYRPVVIPAAAPDQALRIDTSQANGAPSAGTTPPSLRDAIARGDRTVSATYDASVPAGGTGQVAGAFVRVTDAVNAPVAYLGVEVPVSLFAGDTRNDEISLVLISLFVILGTCILVVLFVMRFVRRPVARLERGVARIAGGDYSIDIPVASRDELGRLAASVNRMRAQIAENIAEIEGQRAYLDQAVERLGGVSRALTTTSEGVGALQQAVVRAATSISGPQTAAVIYAREDGRFVPKATVGVAGTPQLDDWDVAGELLAGRGARVEQAPPGWQAGGLLALPMFYQGQVTGALAIFTATGFQPKETELSALSILANNAAVALENTRLFEQEKETVQRLRELDAMKSDFLATVQHELRTPLTAIMGMSDLLEMCWTVWEDTEKLDAVSDIQLASKNLYEIVETIIDFSLLERDTLGLRPDRTFVRQSVQDALRDIAARTKDGLSVSVDVDVAATHAVWADPERFGQVMRALIDNAVKFTPKGGHVSVSAIPVTGEGFCRIEVVDDGIGISAEAIPRLFDRFYQEDNSRTRRHGGMGMGLSLVRRLCDAHGATVSAHSDERSGSKFTILWPLADVAAEPTPAALFFEPVPATSS